MEIVCLGINHETAPVAIREKLSLSEEKLGEALPWLRKQPGVREVLILSTCNRVEFYLVADDKALQAQELVRELFTGRFLVQGIDWERVLFRHSFHNAIAHLFQVTSGMDSMVIGEPQIAGQVKEAYRQAVRHKTVGTILNRLLHKSFTVSKRVRTETELASGAVSVSYVAVELARKIFGDLNECAAMLAGAGEMAELAARHLASHGVRRFRIASRSLENAQKLAASFQAEAIPLGTLALYLPATDILICSTAAPEYVLSAAQVREALKVRKQKPLFIIDISVPRNIDPQADDLENVFLYDLDDLQKVLQTNLGYRRKELKRAETIVQEEAREFLRWLTTLDLVPTIASLRARIEEIRVQELNRAVSLFQGGIEPQQRKILEAMSQAIVNKILHDPIMELKKADQEGNSTRLVDAVQRLFALRTPGK